MDLANNGITGAAEPLADYSGAIAGRIPNPQIVDPLNCPEAFSHIPTPVLPDEL